MDYIWFLFRFEGRINRAKYWLAILIIACWMVFVLMLLAGVASIFGLPDRRFAIGVGSLSTSLESGDDAASRATLFPRIVTFAMSLVVLWCYAATSIKRLHDRNKRGWWMLAFLVAPALYGDFGDWLGDSYAAALVGLAALIFFIWGYVEMGFLSGTGGPNRFGPDPLAPVDTRPRWSQEDELEFVPHSAGPSPGSHVKRGE